MDDRRRHRRAVPAPAPQARLGPRPERRVTPPPAKPKGVVLVSGGMDSLVLAAFATRESDIALLHVNYGQRTEARELACFHAIA
ncbi:MAG: 7-cyano-7-deazaguanine synthase, partial [Deltaproteobacteria bacterium]